MCMLSTALGVQWTNRVGVYWGQLVYGAGGTGPLVSVRVECGRVGLPQNRIHELDIDMAMVVVRHNSLHQSERDGEAE